MKMKVAGVVLTLLALLTGVALALASMQGSGQQELAIQCYKCHVLHMPAQDMKDKMEK